MNVAAIKKFCASLPIKDAAKELGFFGNQNTVARPVTPSWSFTIGRLKERWGV